MKKIVRILVRKAQRRVFNILLDDSSDIIATFIGMETLNRFPYRDDISNGIHRIIRDNDQTTLQEISVDELTALDIEEQKKEGA